MQTRVLLSAVSIYACGALFCPNVGAALPHVVSPEAGQKAKPSLTKKIAPDNTTEGASLNSLGTIAGGELKKDRKWRERVRGHDIIVKFRPAVGPEQIDEITRGCGMQVVYTSPFAGFKRIKGGGGRKLEEVVDHFRQNPNVEYAVPNFATRADFTPNDPVYNPYQWHFDDQVPGGNPYGGANGGGINIEPAWDISTGSGVVVAVLDTGAAYENYTQGSGWGKKRYYLAPDLAGTNFVPGYDFINDDTHPNDDNSHGTHVTGTIAQSTNNGIGVAGVAFECSIMPVKILDKNGYGTLQGLLDAIYYAVDNGADVINMSLSFEPGVDPGPPLKYALDYAYDNGVTVVCSSGNDYEETICYPAAYWTTIAVGATRYDQARSPYSNYGAELDLTAPGGDMSVDQNGDTYGDGVLQNTFNPTSKNTADFGYWFFAGTSMAAPHVSGVAALLIANGTTGADDVRYALQSTAEDVGPAGWDIEYGWGIVDAYAALNAPPMEPRRYTLSDAQLMAFEETYVSPLFHAALVGKEDLEGLGVEYVVLLGGFGEVNIGLGVATQADMTGCADYVLTFTNTSVDDFFSVQMYVKTGQQTTAYESGWVTLMPGMAADWALNLASVVDPGDVTEIGFVLKVYIGQGFGLADEIRVEVKRTAPEW
jgi:serine protease